MLTASTPATLVKTWKQKEKANYHHQEEYHQQQRNNNYKEYNKETRIY